MYAICPTHFSSLHLVTLIIFGGETDTWAMIVTLVHSIQKLHSGKKIQDCLDKTAIFPFVFFFLLNRYRSLL